MSVALVSSPSTATDLLDRLVVEYVLAKHCSALFHYRPGAYSVLHLNISYIFRQISFNLLFEFRFRLERMSMIILMYSFD